MSKPSIGTAITPIRDGEEKQKIKELTVLSIDSDKSIYSLLFSESKNEGSDKQ